MSLMLRDVFSQGQSVKLSSAVSTYGVKFSVVLCLCPSPSQLGSCALCIRDNRDIDVWRTSSTSQLLEPPHSCFGSFPLVAHTGDCVGLTTSHTFSTSLCQPDNSNCLPILPAALICMRKMSHSFSS